jgi:monoterpene epsilon-lactone hydrolase
MKGGYNMANSEIEALRAEIAAHPRPTDLQERRKRMNAQAERNPLPSDVVVQKVNANGIAAEWTITPGADLTRVLFFLHGGGYITGSLDSHRHMVAQAGREAQAKTFAIDYRLAPEYPFPAAIDDALAAYRFLLEQKVSPERIVLAGEAAGGGLALAMLISLRDSGGPLPGGTWVSSPWVDLRMTGATMETKAAVDPLTPKPYLQELADMYLGNADPASPLASPLYADLAKLPPVLIQVGSAETLLDDAVRLASKFGTADVRTTLEIWPEMMHGWHLFYRRLTAGRQALEAAGEFVRSVTS